MAKSALLVALACMLLGLAGCGTIDNATTEGKNAFQAGMRTKDQAKDISEKKGKFEQENSDL